MDQHGKEIAALVLRVLLLPVLSYFMWKLVKGINRLFQRLLPDGKWKRRLNTRLYQGLAEPRDRQ